MLILIVFTVCSHLIGDYYIDGKRVDSNYGIFQKTKVQEKELTGRVIAQQLLGETWNAYGKIPAVTTTHYTGTEEYWTYYAFPYSAVFNFVYSITKMTIYDAMEWETDEADLYNKRQDMLENVWNSYSLSEGEK